MALTYDCFLSYASPDVVHAQALRDCLVAAGLQVWFDKSRLRDGCNWHEEIEVGCEASRIVLPILTPRWKRSEWTRYETYGAETVIPLLYEGTWEEVKTPPLGRWQGQLLGGIDADRLIVAVQDVLARPAVEKSERVAHLRFLANPYFVGREETLNEIHEKLFTDPTSVLTRGQVAAVTALGGVGKTVLARQYAEKFWRCYRQMFWVDCRRSLDGEFALIHDMLRPEPVFAGLKDTDKAIWVRNELNQPACPLRLLILDNAENEESVREWIPKSGNCHTLLTSRFSAWSPGVATCPVSTLKPEPARELLLRRSGKAADEVCASVASKLGYLPLALEQAAAYVAEQGPDFGFADYLRLYESHERVMLEDRTSGSTDYPDSLFLTWATTIEKLPAGARAILRLCAFLAPTPIPVDLLVKGAAFVEAQAAALGMEPAEPTDEIKVREWKRDLARYSMIQSTAGDSFSIHSLVQSVVRHQVPAVEQGSMVQSAVALVMDWAPRSAHEYQNWTRWRMLEAHARFLWRQQSEHSSISPNPEFLIEFAGYLIHARGAYAEAEPLLQQAIGAAEGALGTEHSSALNAMNNLAFLYTSQGRHADAEPLYQRALAASERVRGPEHPSTLNLAKNLAFLYERQGSYTKAEQLLEPALAAFERVLGAEHPDTVDSMNTLAGLYLHQGRYSEAEPLYKQALAAREGMLGAEHPHTLLTLNNLAILFEKQGRNAGAESLYQRALAARERVLGAEHPSTLETVNNLAGLYKSQGKYVEAEALYQRAMAAFEQVLGAEHPNTIASQNNLAALYGSQGRNTEAESLYQRALAAEERVLGAEHPSTLETVFNLALLRGGQGRFAEAESLLQRSLAARERVLGTEHPDTLASLRGFGALYYAQGRYKEAKQLFQRTVAASDRVLGAEHPDTLASLTNLAVICSKLGMYEEAQRLQERALEAKERVLGPDHPDTLISLNSLAVSYSNQRKYAEAKLLHERALSTRERVLGAEHPGTLETVNNLANLYVDLRMYAEAESLYQRALAAKERVLGAEHPGTLETVNNLAALYAKQKRYADAELLFQRGVLGAESALGPNHPLAKTFRANLEAIRGAQRFDRPRTGLFGWFTR